MAIVKLQPQEPEDENIINYPNKIILTFGYGNRTNHQQFLEYITDFNAICVVDIRLTPRAWSRTWYGDKVEKACNSHNVQYISQTSLGNTSGKSNWIPPDKEEAEKALNEVAAIIQNGTVILLCAELDAAKCHRTDVAKKLQELTNAPVKHLR